MEIYFWIVTVLVLWVTLLAFNISRIRIRERVGLGDGGKLAIKKASRAHVNALEHCIPFCLITYVLASNGTASNVLIGLFAVFLLSRFLHAFSYYNSSDIMRQGSATLTYLCLLAGVVLSLAKLI